MKIHLRFGMHRDIEVIHQEADKIDGQVIPAHILAHQTASTAVFVTSLPKKSYVIDPMTYLFQHLKEDWLNDAGEVRISLRKMCEGYEAKILDAINVIADHVSLGPSDLPIAHELAECIVKFQLEVVARESSTSKAAKYLKRYGATAANIPRAIVPPYFTFSTVGDGWYQFSLECARSAQDIAKKHVVMPVVAFSPAQLSTAKMNKLVDDYGGFARVLLWPGDFVQTGVTGQDIDAVGRLVKGFVSRKVGVEFLYGGYLLMLTRFLGAEAVSHGILYTEHKGFGSVPGGGGVPDRYYIPSLHEFRSLSQTDLILHKHRDLMCSCDVCKNVMKGNPDKIILFADNPELLRSHFLAVRRQEADRLKAGSLKSELSELQHAYSKYHDSISNLPNPDSIVDTLRMRGLEYLRTWVAGFSNL